MRRWVAHPQQEFRCWRRGLWSCLELAQVPDRVMQIIAGSAPLSAEIQKFAQSCFNCPARQDYGLTETMAASCVAVAQDNTQRPGTFVRLRDWPESGYTIADVNVENIGRRRGKVLVGKELYPWGTWSM